MSACTRRGCGHDEQAHRLFDPHSRCIVEACTCKAYAEPTGLRPGDRLALIGLGVAFLFAHADNMLVQVAGVAAGVGLALRGLAKSAAVDIASDPGELRWTDRDDQAVAEQIRRGAA